MIGPREKGGPDGEFTVEAGAVSSCPGFEKLIPHFNLNRVSLGHHWCQCREHALPRPVNKSLFSAPFSFGLA